MDEFVPAGDVTYRHYAHRAPLGFKAIMSLPQLSAIAALSKGFDGQCLGQRQTWNRTSDSIRKWTAGSSRLARRGIPRAARRSVH
jgi:hypothetical protein